MNNLELFCYNLVKKNPVVKTVVRNIYQSFFDLMPDHPNYFYSEPKVFEGCYFGFHDQDPISRDGSKVLCNKLTIALRMPTIEDHLDLGYWYGENNEKWCKIAETHAWNYHKGCRLQWVDDTRVIFNSVNDGKLGSTICDTKDKSQQKLSYPIDSVSHDAKFATSFAYGRLQQMMPGYGYVIAEEDEDIKSLCPASSGLYVIDLEKNTRRVLVTLSDIKNFEHTDDMDDAYHFVTHTLFSYDDRYVSCLHRWYSSKVRMTRLLIYDLQTGKLMALPTDGMVSHYVWNTKNQIVAYCRIKGIDSHAFFSVPDMTYKRVGYPELNSDGHQSFINDEEFVTDTYPDRHRYAKLYVVNVNTNKVTQIGDVKSLKKFQSPSDYKHWCCDLHPRYDKTLKMVCFDSVHTGKRSLCLMKYPK